MTLEQFRQIRLPIVEIFNSICGEGISAGFLMTFIRVAGCNLRCSYCDTTYSYDENDPKHRLLKPDEIITALQAWPSRDILCTGGEPLEIGKAKRFLPLYVASQGYAVRIETNGSCPVYTQDEILDYARIIYSPRINYALDVKCPDSGMSDHNIYSGNFEQLGSGDEIKFVVGSQKDLDFANAIIRQYASIFAASGVTLDFSPVFGRMQPAALVEELKANNDFYVQNQLKVRLSLQLHKAIWDPRERGV